MSHSLFAANGVKDFFRHLMKSAFPFYRLCYSLFAFAILAYILYVNFTISSIELWHALVFQKIFAAITGVAGLTVMVVCIRKYFFDLSGIDVFFKRTTNAALQVNGLNKYVRHPLYAGTMLFAWSFFLWQPLLSNFISCVCMSAYTIIGIYFEERRLVKTFGEDYKNYASKVPMIIPGLF